MQYTQKVQELLAQMTLDEKLAQIVGLWSYTVDSLELMEKELKNGVGHITRVGGASSKNAYESAKKANEIQKYLVENTRLKFLQFCMKNLVVGQW